MQIWKGFGRESFENIRSLLEAQLWCLWSMQNSSWHFVGCVVKAYDQMHVDWTLFSKITASLCLDEGIVIRAAFCLCVLEELRRGKEEGEEKGNVEKDWCEKQVIWDTINDVNGKEKARGYFAWSSSPHPFSQSLSGAARQEQFSCWPELFVGGKGKRSRNKVLSKEGMLVFL